MRKQPIKVYEVVFESVSELCRALGITKQAPAVLIRGYGSYEALCAAKLRTDDPAAIQERLLSRLHRLRDGLAPAGATLSRPDAVLLKTLMLAGLERADLEALCNTLRVQYDRDQVITLIDNALKHL